jgi:hypothetical protein
MDSPLRGFNAPIRIKIPRVIGARGGSLGAGEIIRRITKALRVPPCTACDRRAETLDGKLIFAWSPRGYSSAAATPAGRWTGPDGSWHMDGPCTGTGNRQCVSILSSQTDGYAPVITQCCDGWFQYPWILVPPNGPATSGCGFCVF